MTQPNLERLERAQDLLIARGTIGLSPGEAEELRELLAELGGSLAPAEIVRLNDAVDATRRGVMAEVESEMPREVRERIASMAPPGTAVDTAPVARIGPRTAVRSTRLAWLVAAAAVVVAAVTLFTLGPRAAGPGSSTDVAAIDRAADAVRLPFAPKVADYNGVSGEVVWSESLQRGYMRFRGLASNDPKVRQYQLWIVDPKRDQHPVDAGVFDIAGAGEAVVPFESRLHVDQPAAFAVTAEKPGGVVVSAGPLLLVAAK